MNFSQTKLATSVGWKDRRNWDALESRGSVKPGQLALIQQRYREYAIFPPNREIDERCFICAVESLARFDNGNHKRSLGYQQFLWLRVLDDNRRFWVELEDEEIAKLEEIIIDSYQQIERLMGDCVFLELHGRQPRDAEPILLPQAFQLLRAWYPSFRIVDEERAK